MEQGKIVARNIFIARDVRTGLLLLFIPN